MSFISALKSLLGLGPKTANLERGDRVLVCMDCEKDFVFDAGEQRFFKQKGFTDPKRCPRCRKKVRSRIRRRGGRGQGGSGGGGGNNHRDNHSNNRHRFSGRGKHSVIDGDSPYADER